MGARLLLPSLALTAAAAAAAVFGALALAGSPVGGSTDLSTTPPGASVFVDGEFRGVSPVTVEGLGPGAHALRLEKAGYEPLIARLAADGKRGERTFALSPAPRGTLEVTSRPPGAEVFVDGRFRGVTPLALEGIPTGSHVLSVEKANHSTWSGTVLVPAWRAAKVSCDLKDRVLEYLSKALEDESDQILRYMELGHYHFVLGDVENAADVYRRGMVLAADKMAEARDATLRAREKGEQSEVSRLEAEQKSLKTDKKMLDKQIQKDRRSGTHEFRSAMETAQREVRTLFPRSVAFALKEAEAAERRGEHARAAAIIERALKVLPGSARLWERLAGSQAKLGDFDALSRSMARAFKYSRKDAGVRVRLAQVCLEELGAQGDRGRLDPGRRRKIFELLADELARAGRRGGRDQLRRRALMEYRTNREAGRIGKAASALTEALRNTEDRGLVEKLRAEARRWLEGVAEGSPDPDSRRKAKAELKRFEAREAP